ncbi:MAG: hypothetical protein AAGI91_05735 [Bacteroidota bacterium]
MLAALLLPGCAGLFGAETTVESAHAVFVARPGCAHLIARTPGTGYAVLRPRGDYAPRQGDILVGNLRRGSLALGIVPFGANGLDGSEQFEVVQHGLSLAEAQEVYYGLCPLSLDTDRS